MADIAELERRLAAAMDGVGAALEAPKAAPDVDPAEVERLTEQRDAALATAERALAEADGALTEAESLKQALAAEATASAQLRERMEALRETKDSQAERIAELQAAATAAEEARKADRAELDAIIAALEPLVEEQRHA